LITLLCIGNWSIEAKGQTGQTPDFLFSPSSEYGSYSNKWFYSDLDTEIGLSLLLMNFANTTQTIDVNGTAPAGFTLSANGPTQILLEPHKENHGGTGFEQGYAAYSWWKLGLMNGSQPETHRDHHVNFTARTVELGGIQQNDTLPRNITWTIHYEPVNFSYNIQGWPDHLQVYPQFFFTSSMEGVANLTINHQSNIDMNFELELLIDGQSTNLPRLDPSWITLSKHDTQTSKRLRFWIDYDTPEGSYAAAWRLSLTNLEGRKYNLSQGEHTLNFTMEVIHAGVPLLEYDVRWKTGMRPKQEEWFTIPILISNKGNAADTFTIRLNNNSLEQKGFRFKDPVQSIHVEPWDTGTLQFHILAPSRSESGNSYDLFITVNSNTSEYNRTHRFWLFIDFRNPEPMDHVREFIRDYSGLVAMGLLGVGVLMLVMAFGDSRKS